MNSFPHYPAIHSDALLACDRSVPLPPLLPPLKKATCQKYTSLRCISSSTMGDAAANPALANDKKDTTAIKNPRPHKFMYSDPLNPQDICIDALNPPGVLNVSFEQECCFKACSLQRHWGVFTAGKANCLYCRKHRGETENKKTDIAASHDEPLVPWCLVNDCQEVAIYGEFETFEDGGDKNFLQFWPQRCAEHALPEDELGTRPPPPVAYIKSMPKNAEAKKNLLQPIVDLCAQAYYERLTEDDFAKHIKERMDRLFGPCWHVIVGRYFGECVTFEANQYVALNYGPFAIVVFKCG